MKIVCISDTHNHHEQITTVLPEGDMLIHAGDLSLKGSLNEIGSFLEWFSTLNYTYKIFIAGNHDFAFERTPKLIKLPKNVIYLENQATLIEGFTIWGSPVCPPFFNWAFMWSLNRRKELYKTIPDNCDIIINHSPAFACLDKVYRGQNVGCPVLKARIQEIKPKLVVCGHIHEASGILEQDNITFVNAAILDHHYQLKNQPIVIELN